MINSIALIATIIYSIAVLMTSRFFYKRFIMYRTKVLSSKLDFLVSNLNYSFEQMVFMISLPSNLPEIQEATKDQIFIKEDFSGIIYPSFNGIKIYLNIGSEKLLIAYLSIQQFRLPHLDKLLKGGEINEVEYEWISMIKLLDEKTLQAIKKEVFNQLQHSRYNQ